MTIFKTLYFTVCPELDGANGLCWQVNINSNNNNIIYFKYIQYFSLSLHPDIFFSLTFVRIPVSLCDF